VDLKRAQYATDLPLQAGHTYAVKTGSNQTGIIVVQGVRPTGQLEAQVRKVFRTQAVKIIKSLGGVSGATETGDVSGVQARGASVWLDVVFKATN
jgi:hypothetical protein